MKIKVIIGILLTVTLMSVTGFFMVVGTMGGVFAGTCLSSDAAHLVGSDNQAKIYNFWIKNGFSSPQAAGITANLKNESGYNPFRQEMSKSWPNGGYGIAQFTGGQREAVTAYLSQELGTDFTAYYTSRFGGATDASSGFVPAGVPTEVNDKFLAGELGYLLKYISSFKPSSISLRTSELHALTGLSVPSGATLKEFLLTLQSAGDTAKAWTFLYEYPGDINSAANFRALTAEQLVLTLGNQGGSAPGVKGVNTLQGSCDGGTVVAPTDGKTLLLTSGFGSRTMDGTTRVHQGIDIIGGTLDRAAMAGTVTFTGPDGTCGWTVKLDHGNGIQTMYCHMVANSIVVNKGDKVAAGQTLGTMGATGDATGVHLHFQVWVNNQIINPYNFLSDHGIKLGWAPGADTINTKPGPL